ncbi:MAG: hypothetical protein OEV89_00645 [Desulfobulbaceae bacterium]|nr:hypothetical protein [Desulfobulbaceae bacterium]HIJ89351.1 hypothetical protein [Deltaproteobacteria bacterium]
MELKHLGLLTTIVIYLALIPAIVFALPPPRIIAERNLEAEIIVIGEIVEIKTAGLPTPHFILKTMHVIKGYGKVAVNDIVKVVCDGQAPQLDGIKAHTQGSLEINASAGSLVLAYLHPSSEHAGFLTPLLRGLSVVTIGRPLQDTSSEPK